jgi:hypothetical protein
VANLPPAHQRYGYIGVQRLDYGSGHNCKFNSGQVFAINGYYGNYGVPCPLYAA